MTSPHSTIAKAAFAAACLRPDVTKLTRDDVTAFQSMLGITLLRCSSTNIQNCKEWLFVHIVPSQQRIGAFSKYLISLAKYLVVQDGATESSEMGRTPSEGRQHLHILYLLNDILHSLAYHTSAVDDQKRVLDIFQDNISQVVGSLAQNIRARTTRRVLELLRLWDQAKYFIDGFTTQLRKVLENQKSSSVGAAATSGRNKQERDLPYIMPATHGDPDAPYYDLPAANLMPHIIPNEPIPIRSNNVRALQLAAGPPDEALVNAVKDFLRDIKRLDNPFAELEREGSEVNMDELGQLVYRDEANELVGDTYYGWSREFCQKMKSRDQPQPESGRGRTRSYSSSRSNSSNKRRRAESRSSSRGTRSRSPRRQRRSEAYSPPPGDGHQPKRPEMGHEQRSRFAQPASRQATTNTSMVMPPFPLPLAASNGLLIPPPRPPNWQGPWPPPPPPPPPSGYHGVGGFPLLPFSHPPPPPPPL